MGVLKPISAGLFIFECLRLLALVVFFGAAPREGSLGVLSVYLSANALFLLMALFVWLKPEEYRSYPVLYMAGKIIALVTFYVWLIISSPGIPGLGNAERNVFLLGGCFFLCLLDLLSVWGAWMIRVKLRHVQPFEVDRAAEEGGL